MRPSSPTPQLFLADVPGGALLLDMANADVYQLNATARDIWAWRLSGDTDATISTRVEQEYGLSRDEAEAAVRSVALVPSRPRQDENTDRPIFSNTAEDRIEVKTSNRLCATIVPSQQRLSIGDLPNDLPTDAFLRFLAPRLLSLHQRHVLHASVVLLPTGEAVAFSGTSGVGKTTTARLLSEEVGASVVSEDMSVTVLEGQSVSIIRPAERHIIDWIARNEGTRAASIYYGDLVGGLDSRELVRLHAVHFLKERNEAAVVQVESLSSATGAAFWFRQSFPGSPTSSQWQAHLRSVVSRAVVANNYATAIPEGLVRARTALRNHSWMRTENAAGSSSPASQA